MARKLLIMDQDTGHADAIGTYLQRHRLDVASVSRFHQLTELLEQTPYDILLGNPYFEHHSAVDQLLAVKSQRPELQLIIVGPDPVLDRAMDDFGASVTNYLPKPVNSKALDLAITHARRCISNERKLRNYTQRLSDLHKTQGLFLQLFDEVPCYISVQNRDLRLTAANRNFKRDFGNDVGEYCYRVYKHRTSPCPNCPVVQTFKDGQSRGTEEIVTSKSGKQYNVITQTAPIYDDQGNITQVMEMSTNITQIRELQDHLSSLGLMLGSMSHGVKGMLTALDGGIYQMESGLKREDPQRVASAFEQIKQMADRIKKMVLEILYYAKSRELQYETVDVNELAASLSDIITPQAKKNDVAFTIDIPPNLGTIEIDAGWMQSALVNFLENAVDACTYDTVKDTHRVSFTIREAGTEGLALEIRDNGMGMDQETREKMFTLFFTSKGSRGTGLGLFIANHVVENHGGHIQVTSEPGTGTRFSIFLPRKQPAKDDLETPFQLSAQ